jgi:hypothetical protein
VLYLGIALLIVAGVVSLIGTVMLLIAAFRVSVTWGVVVLLVPFGALVFLIKYWQESKRAFFVSLAGTGAAVVGWAAVFFGAAAMVRGGMEEAMAQAAAETTPVQVERARPETPRPVSEKPAPTMADVQRAVAALPVTEVATEVTPESAPDGPLASDTAARPDVPEFESIGPNDIARHIGEVLVVTEKGGRRVKGTLLGVDREALRIERDMSGGSVSYAIARTDIAEVHRAY